VAEVELDVGERALEFCGRLRRRVSSRELMMSWASSWGLVRRNHNPNPMHNVEIPKARPAGETHGCTLEEEETLTITGIGADSSIANGNNPRLARRVAAVVAMFLCAALGAVIIRYSISAALWLGNLGTVLLPRAQQAAVFRPSRPSGHHLATRLSRAVW
jgi:hypothetical protein